jgi:hypothetical protein
MQEDPQRESLIIGLGVIDEPPWMELHGNNMLDGCQVVVTGASRKNKRDILEIIE